MRILVTGGAGFLGVRLIKTLLAGAGSSDDVHVVSADTVPCPADDPRVESRVGTITDQAFVSHIVDRDVDLVFHLAAVLSGQAESEFDTGMRVNLEATRSLLEACRAARSAPRLVFSSTIAVFGGGLPEVIPEDLAVRPQSSYGTEKAICELLVSDYSRRGFVDGVACRVPTVAIRPGAPNSALSSFVSGIIREPLAGIASVCPVPLDTRVWISSPDTATANLFHASTLPAASLEGRRVLNLPGLSVTPAAMLDSLERLGGATARSLVRCEPDADTMRIVCGWPGAFEISRPLALGFRVDESIDDVVRQFMAEQARASH